jgi:hypothetical protein
VPSCKIMTEDVVGVNLRPKEPLNENPIIFFSFHCLELESSEDTVY